MEAPRLGHLLSRELSDYLICCNRALESKAAAFESLQALKDVQHEKSWQCILEFAVDLPLPPALNLILSPSRCVN
jgi:hypothetical protein